MRTVGMRISSRTCRYAVVTVFFACMTALSGLVTAAETETAKPPITSGCEINYPPFCIVDDEGRAGGFSVELMRAALSAMDRAVTFRTGPWAEVRGWLKRGEVQALPLVGRTPERESIFDFTVPYLSLHGTIVVRTGTTGIRHIGDLRGRRVAVMKGDNAEEFLRREDRGIAIRTAPTFKEALQELSRGRHDAVVTQRIVAIRLIQETGLDNLELIKGPVEGFRQDFCFAVQDGDRETLALLNEGLAVVMADGTYRHLHAKWFAALQLPEHRRIVVGGDHNYPPFEFLDEKGRSAGYNVDLTRAIARETGMDIEIRLQPWAKIRRALADGEIDALQGMFYSTQRDLVFDFTPAHTVNHCVAVVRAGEGPAPATVGALAGMRIVVQRGDIMHDFAREHDLDEQVTAVDSPEDALRELAAGKHDCALVSRLTALYCIEKHGWDTLVVGRESLLSPRYCYAVPNNRQALLAQFSEGLQMLKKSGEYRRIREKWMGVYEEKPLSLTEALRYSAMVLVPLLVVFLAVLIWLWTLRRQVASRTAALRKSEEFQRAMIACSPVALYSIDTEGTVLAWNDSTERMLGWTADEVIGAPLPIVPEDRREEFAAFRRKVMETGGFTGAEFVRRKKDGSLFDGSLSAGPIHDEEGKIIGIMASMEDITARKAAERRIEHLNRVLLAIRDVNQLIVRERDPDRLIRAACRILVEHRGYASALIVRTDENKRPMSWAEAGLADAAGPLSESLERGELPPCCAKARDAGGSVVIGEDESACGRCAAALACGSDALAAPLVQEGKGMGYLGVRVGHCRGVDAEERNLVEEMAGDIAYALRSIKVETAGKESEAARAALEDQLRQAQKMEAVGRLAGGVAHDYNNMIGVILGYAEMAMGKMAPADPLYNYLHEIHRAAGRSADITNQLLAFARKQTIAPVLLDLNTTVEAMLNMLGRLIGEDVALSWKPGPGLWTVKVDPAQIDQVLVNLCINARDAIAGVGRVTIETNNVTVDESYCNEHAECRPGEYVMLAVSDDGCGMDGDTVATIFEPFFTTKETERGTGLGLSTVYGIVKQNGGIVNVYSEPGAGTTFKIYLPRHAGEAEETIPEKEPDTQAGRGETLLLVEDEPSIMQLGVLMLEELGYQVLAAAAPGEAITAAAEHAGTVDLLVTDVIMPEMNGRELAERLRERYPSLKTLYMSGYTANVIAHHGVLDEGVHFIEKPFSAKGLAAKVREALEEE